MVSTESIETVRGRLLQKVINSLEGYIEYYDDISSRSIEGWPTFSQSMRIKSLLDHKRILVADDTGINGKTFTAVASKLELDKRTGKRNPALVIAPNSGLLYAWSSAEINRYASCLHAPNQEVMPIEHFDDLARMTRQADFTIINWEKLSIREDDFRWDYLKKALDVIQPELFIFDECHNAKGSSSQRGKTTQRLTSYTCNKYLMLLSATPIPNRYRDLSMIFHMLDPCKYASPSMFVHCPPMIIKELLERQVWFRLTRHDMKDMLGLPDLVEKPIHVTLSDKEAELYFQSWADCVSLGEGLTELRNILYNPALSRYCSDPLIKGSKLKALARVVDDSLGQGNKVFIKTNFVEGVIEEIINTVRRNGRRLAVITADVPRDKRNDLYKLFRFDPGCNIGVSTPLIEESVDLTTGDIPCTIIDMEPPMTPRQKLQFTGRFYRTGQHALVTYRYFLTESKKLNQLMLGYLKLLAIEYNLKIPKKFKPRTLDVDMQNMCRAKEEIIDKIYGGGRISKREEAIYNADMVNRAATYLQGLVAPSLFKPIEPFRFSTIIQARWRNLGEEQFLRLVQTRGWQRWKKMYEKGWKNSASEATLKLIGKLADDLETKIGYAPTIVDIGSGAAYFCRATGKQAICVDLDNKFLATGRKLCERQSIKNEYVCAPATKTRLPSAIADAVVNAYTLFYLGQDKLRTEIEQCILETNRLLKLYPEGHFLLALPYTIEDSAIKRFSHNLEEYGFIQQHYLNPKSTRGERMKNGCHILDFKKTKEVSERKGLDLSFYENRRRFVG